MQKGWGLLYYNAEPLLDGWLGKNPGDFQTRMLQLALEIQRPLGDRNRSADQGSEWDKMGDSLPVFGVALALPELSVGRKSCCGLTTSCPLISHAGQLCSVVLRITGIPGNLYPVFVTFSLSFFSKTNLKLDKYVSWLVWLSGLRASLWTERSRVPHRYLSPFLSLSLTLSKNKFKNLKKNKIWQIWYNVEVFRSQL